MLPKEFESILWEYDLTKLDISSDIVSIRTFTLWDDFHIKFLQEKLWKEFLKRKFFKNIWEIDKKSANYWALIFWIPKESLEHKPIMYDLLHKPFFRRSFR